MSPFKTLLISGLFLLASLILFLTGRLALNLEARSATLLLWSSLAALLLSISFLILFIRKVNLK